nr:MAG TPA_asm: hypothetical protein [Caudoviricetes sp.]
MASLVIGESLAITVIVALTRVLLPGALFYSL